MQRIMKLGAQSKGIISKLEACGSIAQIQLVLLDNIQNMNLKELRMPLNGVFKGYSILMLMQDFMHTTLVSHVLRRFGDQVTLTDFCYPNQDKKALLIKSLYSCLNCIQEGALSLWPRFQAEFTAAELRSMFFEREISTLRELYKYVIDDSINKDSRIDSPMPTIFEMLVCKATDATFHKLWQLIARELQSGVSVADLNMEIFNTLFKKLAEDKSDGTVLMLLFQKFPIEVIHYLQRIKIHNPELNHATSMLVLIMQQVPWLPKLKPIYDFVTRNFSNPEIFPDPLAICEDFFDPRNFPYAFFLANFATLRAHPGFNKERALAHFRAQNNAGVVSTLGGDSQVALASVDEIREIQHIPNLFEKFKQCVSIAQIHILLNGWLSALSLADLRRPFDRGPFEGRSLLMMLQEIPPATLMADVIRRFGPQLALEDFCNPDQKKWHLVAKLAHSYVCEISASFYPFWERFKSDLTKEELKIIFFASYRASLLLSSVNVDQMTCPLIRTFFKEKDKHIAYLFKTVFPLLEPLLFDPTYFEDPRALCLLILPLGIPFAGLNASQVYARISRYPNFDLLNTFNFFYESGNWPVCRSLLEHGSFTLAALNQLRKYEKLPHTLQITLCRKFHLVADRGLLKMESEFVALPLSSPLPVQAKEDAIKVRTCLEWLESEDETKQKMARGLVATVMAQNGAMLPLSFHYHGWTPLMSAILLENVEWIKRFLPCATAEQLCQASASGDSVLSLALHRSNFDLLKRLLERIKAQTTPEFYASYFIDFVNDHHDRAAELITANILDLASLDVSLQQRHCASYPALILPSHAIESLLSKMISRRRELSLENKDGLDNTKLTAITAMASKYPWLSFQRMGYTVRFTVSGPSFLDSIYTFCNKVQDIFSPKPEVKKETKNEDASSSAQTRAVAPVLHSDPEQKRATPRAVVHHFESYRKTPVHKRHSDSSSKKEHTKPKSARVQTTVKIAHEPKEQLSPLSRAEQAERVPLPSPGPRLVLPDVEPKTNFEAFLIEQKTKAATVQDEKVKSIESELNFLRAALAEREKLQTALSSLLQDEAAAFQIFDLAMLDNMFKINRTLAIRDGKVIHGALYDFDCKLIHGILDVISQPQALSHISFFVNECYIHQGFRLLNLTTREWHPFFKLLTSACERKGATETSSARVVLIQSLIKQLNRLLPLLQAEAPIRSIAKHALSACISILGEQLARLAEFDSVAFDKIAAAPLGHVLSKFRRYRNLRHGINKNPLTEIVFLDGDELDVGFVSTAKDWPELLDELIGGLSRGDLTELMSDETQQLLNELIEIPQLTEGVRRMKLHS